MRKRCHISMLAISLALLVLPTTVLGDSHLWRFHELFSNADGTIQFIEMQECCGATHEIRLEGHDINSVSTGKEFYIPADLIPPTSNKTLLFATAGFAALSGAPTPDYIIDDGFFDPGGDTLRYSVYSAATTFFGAGIIPTDGLNSITFDLQMFTHTIGLNSPTNYAGQSGVVALVCSDLDEDGYGTPGSGECPAGSATDCDDDDSDINPGAEEVCGDGNDNDCDGLTDCDDPACEDSCIPTVSTWGIVVLMLTLLVSGAILAQRRVPATDAGAAA